MWNKIPSTHLCGQPGRELPWQPHPDSAVGEGLNDGVDVRRSGARHPRESVLLRFGDFFADPDARKKLLHQLAVV